MVRIDKYEFLEMLKLGVLDEKNKEWHVTSKQRPKRKKRYVIEKDYQKYLNLKNGNKEEIIENEVETEK